MPTSQERLRCVLTHPQQVCIQRGAGIGLVWSHGAYCWDGYFCVQRPPGQPQCIAGFNACFDYCLFGDPGCLKWCQKKQALSAKEHTESTVPSSADTSPIPISGPTATSSGDSTDISGTKVITAHIADGTRACRLIGAIHCSPNHDAIVSQNSPRVV